MHQSPLLQLETDIGWGGKDFIILGSMPIQGGERPMYSALNFIVFTWQSLRACISAKEGTMQ